MKETREFRRRLAKFKTRSKPLERSREFHKKEQTARKRLESFRTRSKPLERDEKQIPRSKPLERH